jgi:hypothetical protein
MGHTRGTVSPIHQNHCETSKPVRIIKTHLRTAQSLYAFSGALKMTVLKFDALNIRNAFVAVGKADVVYNNKEAIACELIVPISKWEELKTARLNACTGYIEGREGKKEANEFYAMKTPSKHPLYNTAKNAFERACKRAAEKHGWEKPGNPNGGGTGEGGAEAKKEGKKPGKGSRPSPTRSALSREVSFG